MKTQHDTTSALSRLQLWSACLGNFCEHYETALFGLLSAFLAPLFFPSHDPVVALILTYAMIPLGMFARPFGAIFFGRIGDLYGRRQALFLTLTGTACVSVCIAMIPTFAYIGFWAPLLICLSRLALNFFSAGEGMGGAIYLMENTPERNHDLLSGIYNASTIAGIVLASAGVSLVTHYYSLDLGWRVLYLFGSLSALFGFLIRRQLSHVPTEPNPKHFSSFSMRSLFHSVWHYRRAFATIAIGSGFSYANYLIALVLMNSFVPMISSFSREEMVHWNTLLLLLDFASLPLFGWIASKVSREKVMLCAASAVVIFTIPLFSLLANPSLTNVLFLRIALVLFGAAFCAPFNAWAQTLVPPEHRYTVISLAYAIGAQLFGGPTAALSLWLYKETAILSSVSWYWLGLACATCFYLLRQRYAHKQAIATQRVPDQL